MHGRCDALHHHHHHYANDGTGEGDTRGGAGHNHEPIRPVQWQTPHADDHDHKADAIHDQVRDLDLVEIAFIEGFQAASDVTSFLRLAGVPFEACGSDGKRLTLLRVEQQRTTDVGSVTPHLGGASFHYAPLPHRLTSRRDALSFIYFDGSRTLALTLSQARELEKVRGEAASSETIVIEPGRIESARC